MVGSIIGEKLPTTDEFKVQGRLTGSAKVLSLSEAQGSAKRGSLSLVLDGGIKDLPNFSGVDLKMKCSGKDLSAVGAIVDEKLPIWSMLFINPRMAEMKNRAPSPKHHGHPTEEFAVEGRLTGSAITLALKEAHGSAKQGSLTVAINGEVKDLIAFSGVDLQIKGSGRNLAEIGPMIGEELPATDEFRVQGRLTGSAKSLSLQAAQGNARRGNLKLSLQGGIKDLMRLSGMDLKLKGSGKDLAKVGQIIEQKLPGVAR